MYNRTDNILMRKINEKNIGTQRVDAAGHILCITGCITYLYTVLLYMLSVLE